MRFIGARANEQAMLSLAPPPKDLLAGAALFLDFDGTLVDLAASPGSIRVPPTLGPMLQRLRERMQGRLAIVSGRSIDDLQRHLDCSGIALSGSHGLEIRFADGRSVPVYAPLGMEAVRQASHVFASTTPGLLVEEKPAGIALHFRQAPREGGRVARFMEVQARDHDMVVQHGNMVVELRPQGATKGDALQALMAEPLFSGARPVFVGDDLTDEHAFEAALNLGGAGVLVGEERPTAATYHLRSVAAVAEWLDSPA